MRPAAQAWERDYTEKFESIGMITGRASANVFYNPVSGIRCVVHGDDFTLTGGRQALDEITEKMRSWYQIKVRGTLGDGPNDDKEITILNRTVRWGKDFVEFEADEKHVKTLINAMGFDENTKSVRAPCDKGDDDGGEVELDPEQASLFRAWAARCNFLSADRPDISFAVKRLCSEMSKPCERSLVRIRRLVRYLIGVPRMALSFSRQQGVDLSTIHVHTDSDWAGCTLTRKSTSGGILSIGGGIVKSWSKTQTTIAKSSGEAEFYAAAHGVVEAIGLKSIAEDLGWTMNIKLGVDSSAAKAMASRTGLGRCRHLEVQYLWLQQVMRKDWMRIVKIKGDSNPADILTKPKTYAEIVVMMDELGYYAPSGPNSTL